MMYPLRQEQIQWPEAKEWSIYSTMLMRVLGLLISSSLSRGTISCDGSSWRRRQMCGQFLCTTERKACNRTILAAQPIAASWSLQNNFYVYAMFEKKTKQWLLVLANSLHCSCSQPALQSLPWFLIIWSQLSSLDAEIGKIWSTKMRHTQKYECVLLGECFLNSSERVGFLCIMEMGCKSQVHRCQHITISPYPHSDIV